MTNYTPTHDEIAAHAYQIYLREGSVEGRDMDHWLKAEAELRDGAANANGNGNGNGMQAGGTERASAPTRAAKTENILPNSVVSPTTPIAQVTRSTTPRKGAGKREAAAAAK
jgi:hypothetical protein